MSADRAARIARLEGWAAAAGARFDALSFQLDRDGDCTARARRAITPGEPIVVIPRALMIDHEACFIPIVDLMNHRRGDTTWRFGGPPRPRSARRGPRHRDQLVVARVRPGPPGRARGPRAGPRPVRQGRCPIVNAGSRSARQVSGL